MAEANEVRVEWQRSDAADLAFLRADSIDVAFVSGLLSEIEDIDRLFRQVHRLLRPGAPFVFSYEHPIVPTIAGDVASAGALPLGRLEVRRSYFEPGPLVVDVEGEKITLGGGQLQKCSQHFTGPATGLTCCSNPRPSAPPIPARRPRRRSSGVPAKKASSPNCRNCPCVDRP